jgi:hypothetical protein
MVACTKPDDPIESLVDRYAEQVVKNRERLTCQVEKINEILADRPFDLIAAWGIGRIFDGLVDAGLDLANLDYLLDTYTPLTEIHGRKIDRPTPAFTINTILVCSRSKEIIKEAELFYPDAEVIIWND